MTEFGIQNALASSRLEIPSIFWRTTMKQTLNNGSPFNTAPDRPRTAMAGLSRRNLLAGAAAVGVSLKYGVRPARAADKVTVRLEWTTSGLHAPFYLALQKGWFEAAGIDLALEDGNGSTTTVQLVGSQQYDVGFAALAPMAIAKAKGLEITSFAGFCRKGDTGIIFPADMKVTKPSDLACKKVGFTAGSLEGPFMTSFFEANGVPEGGVELINVDLTAKITTYVANRVDAMVSTVPGFLPSINDKRPSNSILFADFGFNLPSFGLIATTSAMDKKKETLRRFASVMCGSWTYIFNGHEEEAASAIKAQRPNAIYPNAVLINQIRAFHPFFTTEATKNLPIGIQSESDWAATISAMERAKAIKPGSKPKDYFTNDLIDLDTVKRISTSA